MRGTVQEARRRPGRFGLDPVALRVPGVRRQVGRLRRGDQPAPVDPSSVDVEFGRRPVEAGGSVLVAPQRSDGEQVGVELLADGAHGRQQGGVGAELDEVTEPVGDHALHGGCEPDGFTQVGVPVVGRELPGDRLGGDRRVPGDGGREGGDAVEFVENGGADGLHLGAVGRVVDVETAYEHLPAVEVGEQRPQGLHVSRDDRRTTAVHRRDGHPAAELGEVGLDLGVRERHDGHRTGAGQRGQGLAAQGDHRRRVVETERSGDTGRGDLALAVPDHGVGTHAPRPPHGGEGHHHGEQERLDDVHTVRRRGALVTAQHGRHRPGGEGTQRGVATVEFVGEHGGRVEEIAGHAGPLGALAGEDEGHLSRRGRLLGSHGQRHVRPPVGQPPQRGQQFVAITGPDDGPVLEVRAVVSERPRDGGQRQTRLRAERIEQPARLPLEGGRGTGGEREEDAARRCRLAVRRIARDGCGLRLRLRLRVQLRRRIRLRLGLRLRLRLSSGRVRHGRRRLARSGFELRLRLSGGLGVRVRHRRRRLARRDFGPRLRLRVQLRRRIRLRLRLRLSGGLGVRVRHRRRRLTRRDFGPPLRLSPLLRLRGLGGRPRPAGRRGCAVGEGVLPRVPPDGTRRPGERAGEFRRCLLQHHVGVRTADPERAHPGPPYAVAASWPGLGAALHAQATARPVDVLRRPVRVQGRRDHFVAERQYGLEDAADARRGLRVTDVGLQGTYAERSVGGAPGAEDGGQGPAFDRVAEPRSGAVRLDVVEVVGSEPGGVERRAEHSFLGRSARSAQSLAAAVLVDGRAPDDREHPVPVPACVRESLEQHQTAALGPHHSVRVGGERTAPPGRRQRAQLAELDMAARGDEQGGTARQRHVALPRGQRPRGQVQGDEGGGAGGVQGHRRALEAEGVGDPSGGDAGRRSRADVPVEQAQLGGCHVSAVVQAHVDTGGAAVQGPGHDPGALDGLPGGPEQQPLLRVHGRRLPR
ncbi:hypothetical protein GCM10023335_77980 [Streptomyces siamensis]|uniref:Uncharacterized protein n=1 Tax=Streptomyces siamensis TaxID=1274986 RepID=A0ABP9JJ70_9ACTN